MYDASSVKRVAILGGGMGGLTTAYYLTNEKGWQDRFDVTVYQLGWRLGGKCASSRGERDRIEEHGIHGFIGSYFNALPMMADVYDELDRDLGQPLATFERAFEASSFSMLWEWRVDGLKPWPTRAPRNRRSPRDAAFYKGVQSCIEGVMDVLVASAELPDSTVDKKIKELLRAWQVLSRQPATLGVKHPLVKQIEDVRPLIHQKLEAPETPDGERREILFVDYATTLVLGALRDNLAVEGFDKLDSINWVTWLQGHGMHAATLQSPLPMQTVNICYQSPNGDTSRAAVMSAASYVDWTLRTFAYMDSFLWGFIAGTGETLIAPLYEVLRRRGVKFEFFHKVEALNLDPKGSRVASVDFTVQATLKDPTASYRPLVEVKGLPGWPGTPDYEQLNEGKELQKQGIDLESYWNGWAGAKTKRLCAGAEDGFDELVFAIALGAVPFLCKELMDTSSAWFDMADPKAGLPRLQTQAMQIWLSRTVKELGWKPDLNEAENEVAFSGTYLCPPNGNGEFHDLIPFEGWAEDNMPKALWYFCGLMPSYEDMPLFTDADYPRRARDRVKAQCIQYLQTSIGTMLPNATVRANNPVGDPMGLDFSLLVDFADSKKGPNRVGVQRFESQFWRANIDPTELYIGSPPGSGDLRLEAWGSGFENLTLAGDWIYTGVNVGSVETSVMSGKLASYALSGAPALETVVGYPTTTERPQLSKRRPHYPPPHQTRRVPA